MYGSIGGLEYEVPQSRLYCLCINLALCSTALQCICRVIRRSSMTMKAHTYYIIFGRPPIKGKLPPFPWRRHCSTVHDGLLHPHLRHCSSPASAVRRLPSAVRTATPAFHVRSSGLFCVRPSGLELVIAKFHYTGPTGPDPTRPGSPTKSADFVWSGPVPSRLWNLAITGLPARSVTSFRRDLKTFLFSYAAHRGFAIMRYINLLLTMTLSFRLTYYLIS